MISSDTAQELGLVTLHLNEISTPIQFSTSVTNDDNLNKSIAKHSSVFQGLVKLNDLAVKQNIDDNIVPVAESQRRIPSNIRKR